MSLKDVYVTDYCNMICLSQKIGGIVVLLDLLGITLEIIIDFVVTAITPDRQK